MSDSNAGVASTSDEAKSVEHETNDKHRVAEDEEESADEFWRCMWVDYDMLKQDDGAPDGTMQQCYWTDGTIIVREKFSGIWKYSCEEE